MVPTQSIIAMLNGFDLETLRSELASWPEVTEDQLADAVDWIAATRDRFIVLAETAESPEELPTTLAINYIELKSYWIALNTKINYSAFRQGRCETCDALRATAVSKLLAVIEEFLARDEVETITGFLAEPVRKAA